MGYRPNRSAKALVSRRTHTIALWIDHVHSSVYSQIADGCRLEIQRAGLEINLRELGWHFSSPGHHVPFEWMVDGIIAVDPPGPERLAGFLADEPQRRIPRVHLGSATTVAWEGDFVRVDLQEGTRAAVAHLIREGCRRVAYAVPAGHDQTGFGHFDAYTEIVRGAGLTPEYIVHADWRMPTVRETVRQYVRAHGRPDGIFCHFDEMAIATYRGLRDLSLRIPEDVLIVGCEGNEFLEYFDPALSTVAMPIREMCRAAWRLLERRIAEPTAPAEGILLPYEFCRRASSQRSPSGTA
jgi:LacI family transcriptional regulator